MGKCVLRMMLHHYLPFPITNGSRVCLHTAIAMHTATSPSRYNTDLSLTSFFLQIRICLKIRNIFQPNAFSQLINRKLSFLSSGSPWGLIAIYEFEFFHRIWVCPPYEWIQLNFKWVSYKFKTKHFITKTRSPTSFMAMMTIMTMTIRRVRAWRPLSI